MKKKISLIALSSILVAGTAMASAYRIPEQSVDSTAKAGANIASATHADASYYNPANMSWMEDVWQTEIAASYINLPSVNYSDNRTPFYNGESKKEQFLIPTLFLVSPEMNNFRFGFSVTSPYGLAKRWKQPFPRSYAEEYSLKVHDINPTVSYKVCDMFSIAGGIRMLYSSAKVSNYAVTREGVLVTRAMNGDTLEWGWNLALSAKPMENMNISATYRSNVDLGLSGDVIMGTNVPSTTVIATGGDVSVPAPAVFSLSLAHTFADKVTVDLTWDRTFWSEYDAISFSYDSPVMNPVLRQAYVMPTIKDWDDSNAYRIGVDYQLNESVNLMAGFAYDETPVPDATLGFELPDSDAYLYSIGTRYQLNEQMQVGVSYLYDYKTTRSVVNDTINGEFTDSAAHLLTVGMSYDF